MNASLIHQLIKTAREFPERDPGEVEYIARLRWSREQARREHVDPLTRPLGERVYVGFGPRGRPVFGYRSRVSGKVHVVVRWVVAYCRGSGGPDGFSSEPYYRYFTTQEGAEATAQRMREAPYGDYCWVRVCRNTDLLTPLTERGS
jgi:hypothetical protein